MFANFNKYACDFVSVDDFSYVNTDDVDKAMDVATVEVDKVDSQGGICYWEISILTPFIECDNIPEAFIEKYPEVRRSLKNSKSCNTSLTSGTVGLMTSMPCCLTLERKSWTLSKRE